MKPLTFAQLYVGYKDLLENPERRALLLSTESGRFYEAALRSQFAAMDALGPGKESRAFLARELAEADHLHDESVNAARDLLGGHERAPGLPDAVRALARRALEALPSPSDLRRAYEREVFIANEARERLTSLEPAFRAFPVAGGLTVWDLIQSYLRAAGQIQELLSRRGDQAVEDEAKSRKAALRLRGAAQGWLGRLRARLEDELAMDPALPRDLPARIFAYFDALAARQARQSDPAPDPPPHPTPGG